MESSHALPKLKYKLDTILKYELRDGKRITGQIVCIRPHSNQPYVVQWKGADREYFYQQNQLEEMDGITALTLKPEDHFDKDLFTL